MQLELPNCVFSETISVIWATIECKTGDRKEIRVKVTGLKDDNERPAERHLSERSTTNEYV